MTEGSSYLSKYLPKGTAQGKGEGEEEKNASSFNSIPIIRSPWCVEPLARSFDARSRCKRKKKKGEEKKRKRTCGSISTPRRSINPDSAAP